MPYNADRKWKISLPDRRQVRLLKYLCEKFSMLLAGETLCFYDMLKKYGTGIRILMKYHDDMEIDVLQERFFGGHEICNGEKFKTNVIANKDSKSLLALDDKIKSSFVILESEAYLLRDICETAARISAGQIGAIHDFLERHKWTEENFKSGNIKTKWDDDWKKFERQIRVIYFPDLSPGSSYGVGGKEKHKDSDRAWDLYQVIRRPIHLKNIENVIDSYHSPCTHCNTPMQFSDCKLATLEEVQEGKTLVEVFGSEKSDYNHLTKV